MIETTVGQLSTREIRTVPSPSHFFGRTSPQSSAKALGRPFGEYGGSGDKEDLTSEPDLVDDEVGDLSDSASSRPSYSRPTTPSNAVLPDTPGGVSSPSHHHRTGSDQPSAKPLPTPTEPFSLSQKAERILGLTPGTLPHARACFENACDEVRRLSDSPETSPVALYTCTGGIVGGPAAMSADSTGAGGTGPVGAGGAKGRFDRARKVMSIAMAGSGQKTEKVPSVVLGTGGRDEEDKRERRRRAADGVLYWQKEVGRLEAEAVAGSMTTKSRRRLRGPSP